MSVFAPRSRSNGVVLVEGTHRPDEELFESVQRARVLAALRGVCMERDVGAITVARVVARAGVSRRTFYELFVDLDECFLAAFDEAVARARLYVLHDYDPAAPWAVRVRSALVGLLSFLQVEREAGWLLLIGSLGAGPVVRARRSQICARAAELVDEGREESKAGGGLSPLTAEGIVGGVQSVLHSRMLDDPERGGSLLELTGPLLSMIVLPYLGTAAARRELGRPAPAELQEGVEVEQVTEDGALERLGLRLTYRTVRVLVAIAERPGASNRQVGFAAGADDQGQISKLLARLSRLGLIENADPERPRGMPNAWTLTRKGELVCRAVVR